VNRIRKLFVQWADLFKRFYLIGKCKYLFGAIAERHPYTWFVIRRLLHRLIIFLPHDESYYGFEHLSSDGEEGLFVDIGANDGISALSFRRFNKTYKILSLEPNPIHERKLKNVKTRISNFDYLMVGAGLSDEEVDLFVPMYQGIALHPAACMDYKLLQETMKRMYPAFISTKLKYVKQMVKVVRVDSLNLHPTLVKIDAEGFDYNVLLGMQATIDRARPCILLELYWDAVELIERFCPERSYALFSYSYKLDKFIPFNQRHLRNATGGRNAFCIPMEKISALPLIAEDEAEAEAIQELA
jgi:FkbM family methyltransferase